MWQRFTERARKVVFYAQEEAQRLGNGYVSTEHLLLGICREEDSTASRMLVALGLTLVQVREQVIREIPQKPNVPSQDMTLTPRAKRVIDLSYEEARAYQDGFIGTEHILLGVIREGEGKGYKALADLGVDLNTAHEKLAEVRSAVGNPVGERSEVNVVKAGAHNPADFAERMGFRALLLQQRICLPEFFAMILMADSPASVLLTKLGVDGKDLSNAIQSKITSTATLTERSIQVSDFSKLLEMAQEEATLSNAALASSHFLIALFRLNANALSEHLRSKGITLEDLRTAL